jgi:hypothetical protein
VNKPDCVEQVVDGHSLEQISLGSCLKGAEDIFVAIEGGEDDKARSGAFGADSRDGRNASEFREL